MMQPAPRGEVVIPKISVFGFSRGAYNARVLAGFLYTAGIPDIRPLCATAVEAKEEFVESATLLTKRRLASVVAKLWEAYKMDNPEVLDVELGSPVYLDDRRGGTYTRRQVKTGQALKQTKQAVDASFRQRMDRIGMVYRNVDRGEAKVSPGHLSGLPIERLSRNVEIHFMGLWDTVEAVGFPDYMQNIHSPSHRYVDQICNIRHLFHAVSLDDNRANAFTPMLVTSPQMRYECTGSGEQSSGAWDRKVSINETLDEVWFSGAHSDVGGGNARTPVRQLAGVDDLAASENGIRSG